MQGKDINELTSGLLEWNKMVRSRTKKKFIVTLIGIAAGCLLVGLIIGSVLVSNYLNV